MLQDIAIGVLGLSPATVADMTPTEVRRAYHARQVYDRGMHRRPTLEAGRLAGFLSVLPYSKKNSRDGPADVYPFSWEKDKSDKPEYKPITLTPEEVEAEFNRFK